MIKSLALAGIAAAALVACGPVSTNANGTSNSNAPLQHGSDVSITSCHADPATGFLDAKVTVTNNSSKASNYSITIAFDSANGAKQLDTGLVAVDNLAAGQSSDQDAISVTTATPGYTCKVADATRYAS